MDRGRAFVVALAASLAFAGRADASLTLWPTCTSPPAGDYARCESGAFPQSIVPGPDGALWFTTARADLGRVTPGGLLTQVKVGVPGVGPVASGLLGGLTVGPDAALWFPAAHGPPYLYRATATSPPAFSLVLNPGDTQPRAALLGPDGAIWLAEAKGNSLGRFVPPAGPYSSYALPPKPAGTTVGALRLAAGPDGRFWIPRPRDLVAVTPAGAATAYAIPGVEPTEATTGPDGALWVAAFGTDNVARVSTSGAATVFALPDGSGPSGITTGPDGALYVGLGKKASGILRLTTGGSWTVTPFLFSSQVSSLTTGPDGAIWFADLGASRVGRLTIGAVAAPAVISLSPSTGPAGTLVTLAGEGLSAVRSVTVGGRLAKFTHLAHSGRLLKVTVPAGAGRAPVVVTTASGRSVVTDAATFTYTTTVATAAPPPPATWRAPTMTLGTASLSGSTLTVAVSSTSAAPFDLAAALPLSGRRARIAALRAARLRIPSAGRSRGRFTRSGTRRVRLRLSAAARTEIMRAGRRGARIEVGARLRLGGGQTSVGQRTYRLRAR